MQLRVAEMVNWYPNQCEALFITRERRKLTAMQLYDLFSPTHSPEGSNAKEKELEIMVYWMSFLEECECIDNQRAYYYYAYNH